MITARTLSSVCIAYHADDECGYLRFRKENCTGKFDGLAEELVLCVRCERPRYECEDGGGRMQKPPARFEQVTN